MADPLEKKIAKKKEKKRVKKQQETLNNVSEGKWRRLGAFASWVGYRVEIDGETEVVPVRKKATRLDLMKAADNLKRYIARRRELEREAKKKRKNKKKTPKGLSSN